MKCPNCHVGDLNYISESIAQCDSCGYLLEPRSWGLETNTSPHIHKPDWADRLEYSIKKLLDGLKRIGF